MNAGTKTTDRKGNHRDIALDGELKRFLNEVRSGQCLALAAWATTVLKAGALSMAELEKCFGLGFEG